MPRAVASLAVCALTALTLALGASSAGAHTNGAHCSGEITQFGAGMEGKCEFPFQGFPIGVAGVYEAGETGRAAEIHVEVLAKTAGSFPRPIGIECIESGVTGVARCMYEHNPLDEAITVFEPVPTEIVSLACNAHSHASYSRFAPPSGTFACWSTDEARDDLEADGVLEEIGY